MSRIQDGRAECQSEKQQLIAVLLSVVARLVLVVVVLLLLKVLIAVTSDAASFGIAAQDSGAAGATITYDVAAVDIVSVTEGTAVVGSDAASMRIDADGSGLVGAVNTPAAVGGVASVADSAADVTKMLLLLALLQMAV
ncbi:hypothetical protein NDU88_002503 [Pleurodeles waltl]|uniref:Uncharacterized protein n=1 Tax=Pleurodeles waltl TaxID=8319 RepID=A0AAV7QD49_PLEWA|nr:hypothetical protein NDU88_002503 [Pleurodeles waltl]